MGINSVWYGLRQNQVSQLTLEWLGIEISKSFMAVSALLLYLCKQGAHSIMKNYSGPSICHSVLQYC